MLRPVAARLPQFRLILSCAALALALCNGASASEEAGAGMPHLERVMVLPEPRFLQDQTLTDQHGEPFRMADLKGRAVVLFFGFTNCPDVCPMAMAKFRALENSELVDTDRVAFVLVSVDGERDTPEAMTAFLDRFSDNIVGLTAPPTEVAAFAKQFRAAFFRGHDAGHDHGYTVAHSNQMFLIDPDGRLRAEMHDAPIESMAAAINALL